MFLQSQAQCDSSRCIDYLVGGTRPIHKARPPLLLPLWKNLLKQPFSQPPHLNLHVWHLDSWPKYLTNSHSLSSRTIYESRWTNFESWCKESRVDFQQPSLSLIRVSFTYWFTYKNLKPTTIAGYRTIIADHLGLLC